MGLIAAWLSAMWCGAALHSCSPIDFLRDPGLWIELLSKSKAKKSGAPNFAFELTARKWKPRPSNHVPDLSNLRYLMNGAEQSYISSMNAFANTFAPLGFKRDAFVPGYGLAEHVVYICDRPRDVPLQEIQGSFSSPLRLFDFADLSIFFFF